MEEFPVDSDKFIFNQLWTVIHSRLYPPLVNAFLKMKAQDEPDFIPFFTDEDLARRFFASIGIDHMRVVRLLDKIELIEALEALPSAKGISHVGLDVFHETSQQGRIHRAREIINALRRS